MGLGWYRFADGCLGLATDDAEFAARFHAIYCECVTDEPRSGLVVRCGVTVTPGRVRVTFDPAPDAELIARLLRTNDTPAAEGRWPAATVVPGGVDIDRAGAWQWLAGNLVVNVVLALQPELMFFHAASAAIGDRGLLIMGERGSGKTSLALALGARGNAVLGEEIGALRLVTRELVPVRRSAQIRRNGADADRLTAPLGQLCPLAAGRVARLGAVVRLRRFAKASLLEPLPLTSGNLDGLTLMACSLASNGGSAGRIARLLAVLAPVPAYALDAASPESAAELLERTLAR